MFRVRGAFHRSFCDTVCKILKMNLHPDTDRFARGLSRCLPLAIGWQGNVCRSSSLRYANAKDLVTGEGARKNGGRFNPKGSFPVLYNAVEPETAVAEALADRRRRGLPDADGLPMLLVALRVNLREILDLTDSRVRRHRDLLGARAGGVASRPEARP